MRYNFFGDPYCQTTDEVLEELNDKGYEVGEIYLAEVNGPEGDETMWCGDVSENDTGDTVLYIEAATREAVVAIAKEAGIDDQS